MAIVRATQTMWVSPTRLIQRGDLLESTDPAVKGRPELFGDVEHATAAPGERRHRPKKSTAKKSTEG